LLASTFGSSRQYKIPVQNVVVPHVVDGPPVVSIVAAFGLQVLVVALVLAVIAVRQWLVLRGRFAVSPMWIPATVVAMLVAETLGMAGQISVEITLFVAVLGGA